jgi:hypothetical protein
VEVHVGGAPLGLLLAALLVPELLEEAHVGGKECLLGEGVDPAVMLTVAPGAARGTPAAAVKASPAASVATVGRGKRGRSTAAEATPPSSQAQVDSGTCGGAVKPPPQAVDTKPAPSSHLAAVSHRLLAAVVSRCNGDAGGGSEQCAVVEVLAAVSDADLADAVVQHAEAVQMSVAVALRRLWRTFMGLLRRSVLPAVGPAALLTDSSCFGSAAYRSGCACVALRCVYIILREFFVLRRHGCIQHTCGASSQERILARFHCMASVGVSGMSVRCCNILDMRDSF